MVLLSIFICIKFDLGIMIAKLFELSTRVKIRVRHAIFFKDVRSPFDVEVMLNVKALRSGKLGKDVAEEEIS